MTAVVTGATGFLGTNVVAELVEQGVPVRASGMHGSETSFLDRFGVDVQLADITNPDEVDALIEGADVVYHVAGDTSFWKRRNEQQRAINVDGTMNVAAACRQHGVRRMVHTSTVDVLGHDPSGRLLTEATGRFNFTDMGYNYGETKLEAEQRLAAFALAHDLDTVVIYPGFMCGPYDFNLQLGRMFFDLKEGKLPGAPCGGSSYCHVREVARAHVAAAEKGRRGEAYSCAGWNLPTRTWLNLMADAIGAPRVARTLPERALVAYGRVSEFGARVTGRPPEMNPGVARYLSKLQYQDCSKAIDELGYHIPPIPTIIGDAVNWYRAEGYDL
ncbi:MAG: NAD-dependent epimerase/dehydratase family protein [Actinomycetota bacterium]